MLPLVMKISHYSANEMDGEDDGCLLVYCDEFAAFSPEVGQAYPDVRLEANDIEGAASHPGLYLVKRRTSNGYWVLLPA